MVTGGGSGHGHRRADQRHHGHLPGIATDEGRREAADPEPDWRAGPRAGGGARRALDLRGRGESDHLADAGADQRPLHRRHHQLEATRWLRRAAHAVRTREQLGHLRVLQGRGAGWGRLRGHCADAARNRGGGERGGTRQERRRLRRGGVREGREGKSRSRGTRRVRRSDPRPRRSPTTATHCRGISTTTPARHRMDRRRHSSTTRSRPKDRRS
jgi:hypothetical protein